MDMLSTFAIFGLLVIPMRMRASMRSSVENSPFAGIFNLCPPHALVHIVEGVDLLKQVGAVICKVCLFSRSF